MYLNLSKIQFEIQIEFNSLALNNCFSYNKNVFQNGPNALSKIVLKNPVFWSKSSKFCVVSTIRFCSNFTSMWYKHSLRNVWRDFRLLMSALATVMASQICNKLKNTVYCDKQCFSIEKHSFSLELCLSSKKHSFFYILCIWR